MNNYISLSSLSMDLKRAALGFYKGSDNMAQRFWIEAMSRKGEIDKATVPVYIARLLDSLEDLIKNVDKKKAAEDMLLYSVLFQNAALKLK